MARGGNNGGKRRRVTGGRELSSAREIEVPLDSPSTNESHNEVPLTNDAGGSDLSQQTPTLSAHRPYIFPYKNKFTDPKVGKVIISDFKSMFSGPWPRWTDIPKGHRKLVFESFQRTYQWDSSLDVIVEENWEHIIKKRYSDILSTVRDDAVKMARKAGVNVRDLTDVKPFYPEWIDEKKFAKMIDDVWNTSEWKHVSKSGKDNRATPIEGQMSRHSGGSLSFDHHQLRMEKEKGGPVPEVDVYKETHTKTLKASEKAAGAPTQYTTVWSGMVLEKYLELATERFGSERDTHPKRIDRELWDQASGGMKKGTLFGISNDKRALTTSLTNMGGTSNEVQSMKQQLEEHEKKVEEFRKEAEELRKEAEERATQMTRLQERQTRLKVKEMSGQLAKLTKILNEKFPPSA